MEFPAPVADETIEECRSREFRGTEKFLGTPLMNLRTRFLLFATPFLLPTLLLHGQAVALPPVQAPVWMMVTPENSGVSAVLPAGATYRFGDTQNNLWSSPVTVTEPTTFSPVYFPANVFPFADPDPGTAKELDVLQTAGPQTIMVTTAGTTASLVVPGLVTVPTSIPVPAGTSYTLTFSSFAIAPGTAAGAPMVAFVNAPPTLANQAWQGTQLNLTIDGVTLVCTAGTGSTSDAMTLSCTVPTPPSSSSQPSTAGQ